MHARAYVCVCVCVCVQADVFRQPQKPSVPLCNQLLPEKNKMRGLLSVSLLLLALLLATAAGKHRHHRKGHNKHDKGLECSTDTEYGKCVPESGDCGPGLREATCKDHTEKIHCSIPCNWKKDISDCKYKFGEWGPCDPETLTKSRSGTFKKAFFNAQCQNTVKVSKPCATKPKKTRVPQEKTQ